jgi:hypothetical protein
VRLREHSQLTQHEKTETRDETFERLARDAGKGAGATKLFETLVRRVAKTPSLAAAQTGEEEATKA